MKRKMILRLLFLLPSLLLAQAEPEMESMLFQAGVITQKFAQEVAKEAPPSPSPQPESCLNIASIWFAIDLSDTEAPAFETLKDEDLWNDLREIGVQGIYLKGLKKGGSFRTGIGLDPRWGEGWDEVACLIQKKGIALIGDGMGRATGLSADFCLALKNYGDYPGLYHLIEIEKRDWKWLPLVKNAQVSNVPWLTLQELHKKGYVPEHFAPYIKESSWNTTGLIKCADGIVRRWIYLKENKDDPVLNWLGPSFAACRIASADVLDSSFNLGQKIFRFDESVSLETLALWTRKLGNFSVLEPKGGLNEWTKAPTDMISDTLTRSALLHALIAEDAEALKLIYRLFLEEGIQTKRLAHVLQPFDAFTCDYVEFLSEPKRRFQYREEILTGEALRERLLKEDIAKIAGADPVTWPSLCMASLDSKIPKSKLLDVHLLLALFYAMQPGAFSFSVSDLLGLTEPQTINLMRPNESSLYGSLPSQIKNSSSFAMRLRKILSVRSDSSIDRAELISVPNTLQQGLLVLIHRLQNGMTQMLAINFGRQNAQQLFEMPCIRQTSAIDLMTSLAEKKPLDSATFRLDLPPLSGKVILFQTKYYD